MKNKITIVLFGILFWNIALNAQISTGAGGAASILPNSSTTNTNVGVGTTNPVGKLEVVGSGIFTNSLPDGSVFTDYVDRNTKCITLAVGSQIANNYSRMINFFDFPASNLDAKSNVFFGIEDRADMGRFRMMAQTGGNTQLAVLNKSQIDVFKVFEDGNDNVYMHLPKPNSRFVIGGYGDYLPEHKFVVRGSTKIEGNILTDSNIGIGTSNFTDGADTYRLSVKGKIRAEEVKVYNTWADYVFSPAYELPTLKQVENYIAHNGHLPNVPSAKEITEKGLELGEMAKIQQEKIEELTLYIIAQNKRIEALEQKINAKK
jgi:hypothetical protein